MKRPEIHALIMAAGRSTRMNADKLRMPLGGVPVLARAVRAFMACDRIDGIAIAAPAGAADEMRGWLEPWKARADIWVEGGDTRQDSVRRGLRALPEGTVVLVHDGARPMVSPDLIERCIDSVIERGSGVAALPIVNALHRCRDGRLLSEDRDDYLLAHTPQAFWRDALLGAHEKALQEGYAAHDDASVMAYSGHVAYAVASSPRNVKITHPDDLAICEAWLRPPEIRAGHGYDAHRLLPGRRLVLCGIEVPFERGLSGHSDADAATHALIDALLGAACLGDIGAMFPDSDPRYRDISSLLLLREAYRRLAERGGELISADITIIAQAPRLSPYIAAMREALANATGLDVGRLSVKAKTTETMGFEGRGEGVSAHAVATIRLWDNDSNA